MGARLLMWIGLTCVLAVPISCGIGVTGAGPVEVLDASAEGSAPPDAGPPPDAARDVQTVDGPPKCIPPETSIVGWWAGDGDMKDHAGKNDGKSGTQSSATPVAFATGRVGQAFALGASSYVQIPNAPELQITAAITMEAWIFANALGGRIVDKITAGAADGYMLDTYANKLRLIIGNKSLSTTNDLPTKAWTHVAAAWDGSSARIFVDGVEAASGPLATTLPTTTLALRLGGDSTGKNRFDGMLDEIVVHDRALTGAEIAAVFAAGPLGRCK